MTLNIQRKGKKLVLKEFELKEYMHTKLIEISKLASSVITSFIMVTILAILTIFKAGDIYLYGLIILPLVARSYVYNKVNSWLQKQFQEIIWI
jgi:hypothetical protein